MNLTPQITDLSRKNHILLIEDDPADVFEVEEILHKKSQFEIHHVDMLSSGIEFLQSGVPVDLILLDLYLPDSTGAQNVHKIRSISPTTPVIVMTGLDDEAMALEMVKNGVQDYLVKGSIDSKRLVSAIRYAIEREKARREIEQAHEINLYNAERDHLTGLLNRKVFIDNLTSTIESIKDVNSLLGVVFVDLDGFKPINDNFGHAAGDEVLKHVAAKLSEASRASDLVCRFGGDEFVLMVNQLKDETGIERVINKILASLAMPLMLRGEPYIVSASIGVSIYPIDGDCATTLIKNADMAMYLAKSAGKNTSRRYKSNINSEEMSYQLLEKRLQSAIENNELHLNYQPLVDLATGNVTTVEALARWHDPDLGVVPPDQFIPLAESTGLIAPLGEWIFHKACEDSKLLQEEGADVRVAVNISSRQFKDKRLHRKVIRSLDCNHLDPCRLGVEITESNAMENVEYTIEMLQLFKDIGIQVSIDDFGTGYSSLSYLKRLPTTTLKIDRSFVNGVPADNEDKSIISAIVALSQSLDLEVVAEGVETVEQLEYLKTLRCNKIQGYYFCRPLDFQSLRRFLVRPLSERLAV